MNFSDTLIIVDDSSTLLSRWCFEINLTYLFLNGMARLNEMIGWADKKAFTTWQHFCGHFNQDLQRGREEQSVFTLCDNVSVVGKVLGFELATLNLLGNGLGSSW